MYYEPTLLVDCAGYATWKLDETAGGACRFQGKFQEANAKNKNMRVYPEHVLKTNVEKLKEAIEHRGLFGELDHPTDSIIHLTNASHIITRLWCRLVPSPRNFRTFYAVYASTADACKTVSDVIAGGMQVLVAPDKLKGSLSSSAAAEARAGLDGRRGRDRPDSGSPSGVRGSAAGSGPCSAARALMKSSSSG